MFAMFYNMRSHVLVHVRECDVSENVTSLPAHPPASAPYEKKLDQLSLVSTSQFTTRLECILHFVERNEGAEHDSSNCTLTLQCIL